MHNHLSMFCAPVFQSSSFICMVCLCQLIDFCDFFLRVTGLSAKTVQMYHMLVHNFKF